MVNHRHWRSSNNVSPTGQLPPFHPPSRLYLLSWGCVEITRFSPNRASSRGNFSLRLTFTHSFPLDFWFHSVTSGLTLLRSSDEFRVSLHSTRRSPGFCWTFSEHFFQFRRWRIVRGEPSTRNRMARESRK